MKLIVTLALALAPAIAFANDNHEKKDDTTRKVESKNPDQLMTDARIKAWVDACRRCGDRQRACYGEPSHEPSADVVPPSTIGDWFLPREWQRGARGGGGVRRTVSSGRERKRRCGWRTWWQQRRERRGR